MMKRRIYSKHTKKIKKNKNKTKQVKQKKNVPFWLRNTNLVDSSLSLSLSYFPVSLPPSICTHFSTLFF